MGSHARRLSSNGRRASFFVQVVLNFRTVVVFQDSGGSEQRIDDPSDVAVRYMKSWCGSPATNFQRGTAVTLHRSAARS